MPHLKTRLNAALITKFWLGVSFLLLLSSNLKPCFAVGQTDSAQSKIPKGIVLIVIDDIGYGDIDVLHPSDLNTPNLDSLCQQSLRLSDFHVGTTCSPSRASLLTGRSVNAGGVWHTIAGREVLREDEQTMAEVFKANGWRTGVFGKWHLGEGYPFSPRFRGFDVSVIHGGGGVGQGPDYWQNDYYSGVDFEGKPTVADVYFENGKPFKADQFCTDLWFDRSKAFIQNSIKVKKPFFCYLPTNAAHGPFNAPHGFKKGFDGLIENIDFNMGKLDEFLIKEGIKDDVLVIFMADNGTAGSRRGGLREKKGSNYDGGHNVPCFMRWKSGGIGGSSQLAREETSLTAAMDLLPTFIDMFDLKKPAGGKPIHGLSLKSRITNKNFTPRSRTLVVDTQRAADLVKWKRACVMQDVVENGVVKHKWRLIRKSEQVQPELYDFKTDRDTDDNIAEKNSATIESLSEAYEAWWKEISPGWKAFPPFVLNDDHEAELTLFSHSWIGNSSSPWHQNQVKKGGRGTAKHSIRFDKSGRYQFELRRWPREDGGDITGKSSAGIGKVINAKKARVTVDGIGTETKSIEPGQAAVLLEMDVTAGKPTTLVSEFLDENDQVLAGAYYVYIKRTKTNGSSTAVPDK